ncbi:MAG: hypothetical protein KAJ93_04950 [Methanosarcinales archaeon]|nr:hypothetical protein [Methanosarcinales archaeon]
MKIKCDFCDHTASGTKDQLIDMGWNRTVISAPVRKTITACRFHTDEFQDEIMKVIKR